MSSKLRMLIVRMNFPSGALPLFVTACALFLVVRLVVAGSAVDRIRGADKMEYQIAEHASLQLGRAEETALSGPMIAKKTVAWTLVPLLVLKFPPSVALKFVAIAFSFVGFASIMLLLIFRAGRYAAGAFALLAVFPEQNHLTWDVTLWGSYNEACGLLGLTLGLWLWADEWGKGARGYFLAGLAAGLAVSATVFAAFSAIPLMLVMSFPIHKKPWRKAVPALWAGFLPALIPAAILLRAGNPGMIFDLALFAEKLPGGLGEVFMPPTWNRMAAFFVQAFEGRAFLGALEWGFLAVAFVWVTARAFLRKQYWTLVFPFAVGGGLKWYSVFLFPKPLDVRQFLWIQTFAYVCIAVLVGDFIASLLRKRVTADFRWFKYSLPAVLILLLFARHIGEAAPLMRPSSLGMLGHYRGLDYYQLRLQEVVGGEVRNVNCLLDKDRRKLDDNAFRLGFSKLFLSSGAIDCCLWEPSRFNMTQLMRPADESSAAEYFQGVGCAMALKPNLVPGGLQKIRQALGEDAYISAGEGYDACAALPCITR